MKGCSVRVSIKFPREDEENDKNKKAKLSKGSQLKKIQLQFREEIQLRVKDILENPYGLIELNRELAQLKENQRRRFLGSITSTNYLEENIQTVERWAHRNDDNRFKMALYQERVDECRTRKEEM